MRSEEGFCYFVGEGVFLPQSMSVEAALTGRRQNGISCTQR